mmetsp:Transcript_39689/g.60817  ORF Transcript_39689/g.60817 Transcript_39689/m.60817 type:complete len:109 (-) Transcript_39689:1683-2009(-)
MALSVKSGQSFLSRDKLANLQKAFEEVKKDTASRFGSQRALSEAPPLSQILSQKSKLKRIDEVTKADTASVHTQQREQILGEISEYLKTLKVNEKENFEQLLEICRYV